jgi:hypothetical protein
MYVHQQGHQHQTMGQQTAQADNIANLNTL